MQHNPANNWAVGGMIWRLLVGWEITIIFVFVGVAVGIAGGFFLTLFMLKNSCTQVFRTVCDIEQVCQIGLFVNGLATSLFCSTGIVEYQNQLSQSVPMIMNQEELALMEVKQQKRGEISQKLVNFSMLSLNETTLDEMSCLSKKNLH